MNPDFQEIAALLVVALAAAGLLRRCCLRRKYPACDGGCACPAAKLRR